MFAKRNCFLPIHFPDLNDLVIGFCMDTNQDTLVVKGISVYGQKSSQEEPFRVNPKLVAEVFQPQIAAGSQPQTYILRVQPLPDWPITIRRKKDGSFASTVIFPSERKQAKLTKVIVRVSNLTSTLPTMSFTIYGTFRLTQNSPSETLSQNITVSPSFVRELKSFLETA